MAPLCVAIMGGIAGLVYSADLTEYVLPKVS